MHRLAGGFKAAGSAAGPEASRCRERKSAGPEAQGRPARRRKGARPGGARAPGPGGARAPRGITMRSGFRPDGLRRLFELLKRRKPLHTIGVLGRFGPGTLCRKRSCRVSPAWTRRPRSTHLPARCFVGTA